MFWTHASACASRAPSLYNPPASRDVISKPQQQSRPSFYTSTLMRPRPCRDLTLRSNIGSLALALPSTLTACDSSSARQLPELPSSKTHAITKACIRCRGDLDLGMPTTHTFGRIWHGPMPSRLTHRELLNASRAAFFEPRSHPREPACTN